MMMMNFQIIEPAVGTDEQHVIEAAKRGERSATRKILQLASVRIRRTARYLCANDTEREDLVQNVLIEVLRALQGFKGESSFSYWVDRVTLYTASKHIGKVVRRRSIEEQAWFPGGEQMTPETSVDESQLRERFRGLLGEMKPALRSPLVLHYLYGYTVDEISDLMSLRRNTVRGRLRTALGQIRRKVQNDAILSQWIGKC